MDELQLDEDTAAMIAHIANDTHKAPNLELVASLVGAGELELRSFKQFASLVHGEEADLALEILDNLVRVDLATRQRQTSSTNSRPERVVGMRMGTVRFYNAAKGFGFIEPDDGGKDVFVHASALERSGLQSLYEGQKVAYATDIDSRSGKSAVSKIDAA